MRLFPKAIGGAIAATAALALAACGGGETEPDIDDTVVTDLDPMDGSIDDTTVIDATIGSEERAGMEGAMPANSDEPTTEAERDGRETDDDDTEEAPANDVTTNEAE